ncbi:hypothetical protein [Mameliella sp.]|uniref:hypothetical protein n=1 Tax=Mameliella sp. TaxID=1924940 RepID=UPI003B50919A
MLRHCLCCLLFFLIAGPVRALDAPQGRPLLIVGGMIAATNDGALARFDRAMLQALDWQEIETYTEFTEGVHRLAGPSLASLLAVLGVESGTLRAVALDDYVLEFPVSDAADFGIVLAIEREGKPFGVRNRGPIWLVYPAPTPEEAGQFHTSRMIWQLTRLTVGP